MNDVKELLTEEIKCQIEALDELEFGSDEHKRAIDDLTKLLDKLNEIEKIEIEHKDKVDSQERDTDLKLMQMNDERKDRIVKNCLTALSVIGGMGLTVWGTCKSIEFEKTGTITTIMGRGFINKLLPKK
jgi:hypothetical protein